MKTKLIAFMTLMSLSVAGVTLTWSPSPSAGVTGYRVYSSTNGTTWKLERGVSGTSVVLTNVAANVIAYGVSATNAVGSESSKLTAEVLMPPTGLRIIESD